MKTPSDHEAMECPGHSDALCLNPESRTIAFGKKRILCESHPADDMDNAILRDFSLKYEQKNDGDACCMAMAVNSSLIIRQVFFVVIAVFLSACNKDLSKN
jgi:hypothetical protein